MQADWEIELGSNTPVIDAAWPEFVDLRYEPERAHQLAEAALLPGLASVLIQLNSDVSSIWTSKCDVWSIESLDAVHFDRFDLDAGAGEDAVALGCYIDLLARDDEQWSTLENCGQHTDALCKKLQRVAVRCCRIDLIVRQAYKSPSQTHFGITAYLTACGHDAKSVRSNLVIALRALADAVLSEDESEATHSTLQ